MGLKIKDSRQLQDEYLEIVSKRLNDLGLEIPNDVKPDYDMRVGYQLEEAATV
jgi:ring-1,2-phenylacetyl-CoA epoxidase subunit PaaA